MDDEKIFKLRTGVSPAYWFTLTKEGSCEYSPAKWKTPRAGVPPEKWIEEDLCWLDHQLEGGIELPDELVHRRETQASSRGLTIVVSGPPGSGKSVLAMELCYRLSLSSTKSGEGEHRRGVEGRDKGLLCFYVSSEDTYGRILQKATSLGWKDAEDQFLPFGPMDKRRDPHGFVSVYGQDEIDSASGSITDTAAWLERTVEKWSDLVKLAFPRVSYPDVLVVDSLNLLHRQDERTKAFLDIAAKCTKGPMLIVFVVEAAAETESHRLWEYACDIEIRLDRKYSADYMLRTIEVVKARNQSHVWGPQQLKIYGQGHAPTAKQDSHQQLLEARRRHPYRSQGGIFIYPSIHYYLSVYKRQLPSSVPENAETPLPSLNKMINHGFPPGRCTAFIGVRGGHKSHLGYYHLLSRVLKNQERALVISLRDDEEMAKKTMSKIVRQHFSSNTELREYLPPTIKLPKELPKDDLTFEENCLQELEKDGRLEVLYYPPGYISPEEFFHRTFISIRQMARGGSKPTTVLFNSLDQLSARFPLCAKESIFIPGLIDMLTAENITSIFVAVTEPGQPPEQYGLLSMADLILSFSLRRFSKKQFADFVPDEPRLKAIEDVAAAIDQKVQKVVLSVVRVPGGQAAGARGILELIEETGLSFRPIDERVGEGEPVGLSYGEVRAYAASSF